MQIFRLSTACMKIPKVLVSFFKPRVSFFCAKYIMFDLKKCRGVISHDTGGLKNDMVWKITRRIWQIFTRTLESVKIGTLMRAFFPK